MKLSIPLFVKEALSEFRIIGCVVINVALQPYVHINVFCLCKAGSSGVRVCGTGLALLLWTCRQTARVLTFPRSGILFPHFK